MLKVFEFYKNSIIKNVSKFTNKTHLSFLSNWHRTGRRFLFSRGFATTTWLTATGAILAPLGMCHCCGMLVHLWWSGTCLKLWSFKPWRVFNKPTICEQWPFILEKIHMIFMYQAQKRGWEKKYVDTQNKRVYIQNLILTGICT